MKRSQDIKGDSGGSAATWIPGVHLRTDAGPDFFSIESVLEQSLRPGMSHEEKARALRDRVWALRYNSPDSYPVGRGMTDPVALLNAFPGTICSQDAASLCALWIAAGYDARAVELAWHTTPEVRYEGDWHNFDATLWERHKLQRRRHTGSGTSVLSARKRGVTWARPGATNQRWDDFDAGHTMHVDLRRGESFTRYWTPLGAGPDYRLYGANGNRPRDTRDRMHWAFDLLPRPFAPLSRETPYANGVFDFRLDTGRPDWRSLTERATNLCTTRDGSLRPRRAERPGIVDIRVRTPYPVTGALVHARLRRTGTDDGVRILVSLDDGRSWKPIHEEQGKTDRRARVSLSAAVRGTFEFLVRIEMTAGPHGGACRLHGLRLVTIVQVNPFTLPSLRRGPNRVRVTSTHPVIGQCLVPDLTRDECLAAMFRHRNVCVRRAPDVPSWAPGLYPVDPNRRSEVVYRVRCPGELVDVEWGGRFLTLTGMQRGPAESMPRCENAMTYSFDGRTWHPQPWTYRYALRRSRAEKLQQMHLERIPAVPPGSREVYLAFAFRRRPQPRPVDKMEELLLASLRIRANYRLEGSASPPPMQITYAWEEEKGERTHTERVAHCPAKWTVHVGGRKRPAMKWFRMEVPAG